MPCRVTCNAPEKTTRHYPAHTVRTAHDSFYRRTSHSHTAFRSTSTTAGLTVARDARRSTRATKVKWPDTRRESGQIVRHARVTNYHYLSLTSVNSASTTESSSALLPPPL